MSLSDSGLVMPAIPAPRRCALKPEILGEIRKLYKSYDEIPARVDYGTRCGIFRDLHGEVFGIRAYRIGTKTWTHGANLLTFRYPAGYNRYSCRRRMEVSDHAEPATAAKPPLVPARPNLSHADLDAIKNLLINNFRAIPESELTEIRKLYYEPSNFQSRYNASVAARVMSTLQNKLDARAELKNGAEKIVSDPIEPAPLSRIGAKAALTPQILYSICLLRREYDHPAPWIRDLARMHQIGKKRGWMPKRLPLDVLEAIRFRRPAFVAPAIVPFKIEKGRFWSVYVDAPLNLFRPVRPGKTSVSRAVLARIKARGAEMRPRLFPNAVYIHQNNGTMHWSDKVEKAHGTLHLINLGDMIPKQARKVTAKDVVAAIKKSIPKDLLAKQPVGYFATVGSKTPKELPNEIVHSIQLRRREYVAFPPTTPIVIQEGKMWTIESNGSQRSYYTISHRHHDTIRKCKTVGVKPGDTFVNAYPTRPLTDPLAIRKKFNLKYVAVALSFSFWSWIRCLSGDRLLGYEDATVLADIKDAEIKELLVVLERLLSEANLPDCLLIKSSTGRDIFCATKKQPIRFTQTYSYKRVDVNRICDRSTDSQLMIHSAMTILMLLIVILVLPVDSHAFAYLLACYHLVMASLVAAEKWAVFEPRDRVELTGTLDPKLFIKIP